MNPYEQYNNCIGVQARFLYESTKQVKAAEGSLRLLGYESLNYKVKNQAIKKLRSRGPNTPLLVCFKSLPTQWQKLLVQSFGEPQKQVRQTLFEQYYRKDVAAWGFYIAYKKSNGIGLDNTLIEKYTLNASVLNAIYNLNKAMCDERRKLRGTIGAQTIQGIQKLSVWNVVVNEAIRFRAIEAHTLPDHADSIRKLLNRFKKEGPKALINGRVDNNNARVVTNDVVELLNNLFAGQTHKPNYSDVANTYESFLNGYTEVINNSTGEMYNPKEFPKLSKASITNYLSEWTNKIGNEMLRDNNRQRMIGKYIPYQSFEKPKYSGSILSIDDRQPPFKYDNGTDSGARMWFYMGIDLASEAWTCWVYGESKVGIILEFYRQMVRNYAEWGFNLPAELEGEMSLNSAYLDTFLKEGEMFEKVHIEANNARGKGVERYFGKLRYSKERIKEGWIARPKALAEANQGDDTKIIKLPKTTIIQNSLHDIEEWNNEPHRKAEGKTRWEYFCENQHPKLLPTNYHAILPHIGYSTKTSCKVGNILLNNATFLLGENGKVALGNRLIELMAELEGQDIHIRWLDNNDGSILKAFIYIGTQYYCEAVAKPLPQKAQKERTDDDNIKIETLSSYATTVQKFMKERMHSVDKVTVINNTPVATPKNAFKIKGLLRYEPTEKETEILPPLPTNEFQSPPSGDLGGRSLKDRF
jgi:hypothetical protein